MRVSCTVLTNTGALSSRPSISNIAGTCEASRAVATCGPCAIITVMLIVRAFVNVYKIIHVYDKAMKEQNHLDYVSWNNKKSKH